jgi:hypothetical protein
MVNPEYTKAALDCIGLAMLCFAIATVLKFAR